MLVKYDMPEIKYRDCEIFSFSFFLTHNWGRKIKFLSDSEVTVFWPAPRKISFSIIFKSSLRTIPNLTAFSVSEGHVFFMLKVPTSFNLTIAENLI